MKNITAANSIFLLAISDIFPVAQQLVGYAADAAFTNDAVTLGETIIGVDGKMSAGYLPFTITQTIVIMPDSDSLSLFEEWVAAEKAARELYFANATILIPSIGRQFLLTKGALTSAKIMPDVKKFLQPSEFKITWESVDSSVI